VSCSRAGNCRAVETAERLAQHAHAGKVRRVDELDDATKAPPADRARRGAALRRIAGTPPAAGTNTVVVTHVTNVGDAFGPGAAPVGDGELVILRPLRGADGRSSYRLVHRLRVQDLSALRQGGQVLKAVRGAQSRSGGGPAAAS
jgi:hypothetical protein